MNTWTRIQPGTYISGGFRIARTESGQWAVTLHGEPKRTLKTLVEAKRFVFQYLSIR